MLEFMLIAKNVTISVYTVLIPTKNVLNVPTNQDLELPLVIAQTLSMTKEVNKKNV